MSEAALLHAPTHYIRVSITYHNGLPVYIIEECVEPFGHRMIYRLRPWGPAMPHQWFVGIPDSSLEVVSRFRDFILPLPYGMEDIPIPGLGPRPIHINNFQSRLTQIRQIVIALYQQRRRLGFTY